MTLQRVLAGISALILFYFAFKYFLIAYMFAANGSVIMPSIAILTLLVVVTMAVCFVTSYRQLFTQRPKMVALCLVLIITCDMIIYFVADRLLSNPEIRELTETFNQAIIEGLEKSENIPNKEKIIESYSAPYPTLKDSLQSLLMTATAMMIPIYTNFRKLKHDPQET